MSYDYMLRNGGIVGGTGSPWYRGDVAVGDGRIAVIAEGADLDLMVGCMLESSIGIHASAHVVSGIGAFSHVDLDGNRLLAEDVVESGDGPIHEIAGPGHGVTPDRSSRSKRSVGFVGIRSVLSTNQDYAEDGRETATTSDPPSRASRWTRPTSGRQRCVRRRTPRRS